MVISGSNIFTNASIAGAVVFGDAPAVETIDDTDDADDKANGNEISVNLGFLMGNFV